MDEKFICAFDGPWHLAENKTSEDGERVYVVTACSKRQIGGAWGHRTYRHPFRPQPICKNCQKKLSKGERHA